MAGNTARLSIKDIVAREDFYQIPLDKRISILGQADANFNKLAKEDQVKFAQRNSFTPQSVWDKDIIGDPEQYGVENRVPPEQDIRTPRDMGISSLEFLRPILDALATGGGAYLGKSGGPHAATRTGIGMGAGTDLAIQELIKGVGGEPRTGPMTEFLGTSEGAAPYASALEIPATDELLGVAGRKLWSAFKLGGHAILGFAEERLGKEGAEKLLSRFPSKPKTGITDVDRFMEIPGTYGTMSDSSIGRNSEVWLSLLRGPQIRRDVATAVGKRAERITNELAENPFAPMTPDVLVQSFRGNVVKAQKEMLNLSHSYRNYALQIAKLNPGAKVDGPIPTTKLVQWADGYLENLYGKGNSRGTLDQLLPLAADAEKPLVRLAKSIQKNRVELPDGQVIGRAMSFENAWNNRATYGDAAFGTQKGAAPLDSNAKKAYAEVYGILSESIGEGISKWKVMRSEAYASWQAARAVSQKRINLFQKTPGVKKFVEDNFVDEKAFKAILSSPKALQNAVKTGAKTDEIAAYNWMQTWRKSWNPREQNLNGADFYKEWFSPENQENLQILFRSKPEKISYLNEFASLATKSTDPPAMTGRTAVALRLGSTVATLGGGIVSGILPGSPAVIVGSYLGLNQFVRRVLLNDRAARAYLRYLRVPSSQNERMFSRVLGGTLQGASVLTEDEQGNLSGKEIE